MARRFFRRAKTYVLARTVNGFSVQFYGGPDIS
jgi:hypothetical protein